MVSRISHALFALALTLGAHAAATEHALVPLPSEKLKELVPILAKSDLALIESEPNGRMKQVTVAVLCAAPSEVVRDVLATPEQHAQFIRNLAPGRVVRNPDGTIDEDVHVDFTITQFDGAQRYRKNGDGSVEVRAIDPNDDAIYRWEFFSVPEGTVVVEYGYTDVLHSNRYIRNIIEQVPSMEHGLGLSAQLALVRQIKDRAERVAHRSYPPVDPKAKGPGFDFLLRRGRVALIRSDGKEHLADVSILDRIYAPKAKVESTLLSPSSYASFLEGIKRSYEVSHHGPDIIYQQRMELAIFSWETRFNLHPDGQGGVDVIGIDGDLRNAHYRWDLSAISPGCTLAIYRARQDIAAASPLLFGVLFHKEPLFEHGLAVAFGLVQLTGVRGRAEGWR